ncbi:LOB domain-containing protein 42-like [Andrographis paniculata]|uniref:LOB domain-containing protein 42-like n=1 Tax=Andrographis paniculata TaxID=175694 RepID=UPI0021E709F5|nr:LOB domain-containing protein 42-like [Andrographis paniculata]
MSCNGCRVLRKGCVEGCVLRPSLVWIRGPEAQANATLFLAKFYGRAGLINLIKAGTPPLRPDLSAEIFKSLLYDACGRVINPVFGATGLTWSGNWRWIEGAVDAVLRGAPLLTPPQPQLPAALQQLACYVPFRGCDIRRISRYSVPPSTTSSISRPRVNQRNRREIQPAGWGDDLTDLPDEWLTLGCPSGGDAGQSSSSVAGGGGAGSQLIAWRDDSWGSFPAEMLELSLAPSSNPDPSGAWLDLTLGLNPSAGVPRNRH